MDKELMLRYFETEYKNPMNEIEGDDPELKKINNQFIKKSEELCQFVRDANFPV